MQHRIKFVPVDQMPEGHLWVMCRQPEVTTLVLSTAMRYLTDREYAHVLEEAWGGYRGLRGLPLQRVSA